MSTGKGPAPRPGLLLLASCWTHTQHHVELRRVYESQWSWSHSLVSPVDATTPWRDKEGQERPSLDKIGCILKACPYQRWT